MVRCRKTGRPISTRCAVRLRKFSPLLPLASAELTARTCSHVLCAAAPRGDDRHLLRCFRQDLGERYGRARVQAFRRRARYRYQPRVGPCFYPFSSPPLPFPLVTWRVFSPPAFRSVNKADHQSRSAGRPLSHNHLRSPREDEFVLPGDKRPHQQTE